MDDLQGRSFKGYELGECLGQGGFGTVYRAFQPLLDREVAIKVIRPAFANHPDFIRRFETEAHLVARLEHPHIVPLYDYWRDPTGAFLVMRWIRGGSLQTALTGGPLAVGATIRVLEQLAAGLTVAHRHGVIHRDLKPANVLRDEDGNTYLADFGIAKDLSTGPDAGNTSADGLVGSPAYMAPEQIKQEPVTVQTDIYLLGVLLYEVLTGQKPFGGSTPTDILYQHLYEPLPSLRVHRPELPSGLDQVLQRATQKPAGARYPDVANLLADFVAASGGVGRIRAVAEVPAIATVAQATEAENPYKGLRAFQEVDAPDFFGRETLVGRLLARLGAPAPGGRFLAVVGPSGSGKSSVVRAGLLPALRAGAVPGSSRWFFTELVPGPRPLEELEAALLRIAVNPPASLLEQLQADTRGLSRAVKRVLPADGQTELVLLIDQFEEVFTLVEDEATRARVLSSLVAAVSDPRSRLRLILTLRADFYDRPLLHPELGELLRQGTELALPLTLDELEQAIVRPATRAGVTVEPALLAALAQDVAGQPGTLPLLQYALTEIFAVREGRQMTRATYATTVGVFGALGRRADEIYATLSAGEQPLARQVFLRLITPGEGVEDTRRRVRQSELRGLGDAGAVATILERFGQHRLLTFDRDPITREPTVEVAHEALIRSWGRLREWLENSRMDLRTQRQVAAEGAEWERAGRDPSFLATGTRLAQFAALENWSSIGLTAQERDYLAASQAGAAAQQETERTRQAHELALARASAQAQRAAAQRLRILVGAMVVFLVITAALALFAFTRQAEASRQQAVAEANATRSEALRLATEANTLLDAHGDPAAIALLAIRSLRLQYSHEGDAVLVRVAGLAFPARQFTTHAGRVTEVALSRDGKLLLTTGSDQTAQLWDAATGRELHKLVGHSGEINDGAFSPDGRFVATTSADSTIRVWDTRTGAQVRVMPITNASDVAYSPDGRYILAGSSADIAWLYDANSRRLVRSFTGHTGVVFSVAFSPDSRLALTGSADHTARLWDVATGKVVRVFEGHTGNVYRLTFTPDARTIITTSDDGTVRVWDTATGNEVRRIDTGNPASSVAVAPDGQTLLTGGAGLAAQLWDLATGQHLQDFSSSLQITSVAFAPDGQFMLTGSADGMAQMWTSRPVAGMHAFSGHTDYVTAAVFSPDSRRVLTGSQDKTARLWDVQTGQELQEFTGHKNLVSSVAFAPDGKTVLTGSADATVQLWNVADGKPLYTYYNKPAASNAAIYAVAFSPDGKYIAAGGADWTARLWDVQTHRELQQFLGHLNVINILSFSPDSRFLLTGSGDTTARLWDIQTASPVLTFTGHTGSIGSVAFSPDGNEVLTGSDDKTARLWSAKTGQLLQTFTETSRVWGVAFSPDSRRALLALADGTGRILDLTTGVEVRRLLGHTNSLLSGVFSPDGKLVLTTSADMTARVWQVDYRDSLQALCARLTRDFSDAERAKYEIADKTPTCPGP